MKLLLAMGLIFSWKEQEFVAIDEVYSPTLAMTAHGWVPTALYSHEILILDPNDSPLLSACYEEASLSRFSDLSMPDLPRLFSSISTYLHTKVFTLHDHSHKVIDKTLHTYEQPCLPLDTFIALHVGVCRHYVLTAAYLLARLQRERGLPLPEMRIVRRTLSSGRHAWLQVGQWHFDPYWNLIADMNNPCEKEFLYQVYQLKLDESGSFGAL